ncbi:MAG: fibrobacter succinogenes major paralogous domain-containing protein, partial [Bacteroidota bacterium]
AENLRARTYRNGVVIPQVTDASTWSGLSTDASCWYNNDSATYACPYGRLYNWYAVSSNNVCPTGWHVPTDAEWTTLENQLGGSSIAGGKMKSTGTQYWQSPNSFADNSSGFSGLAGGSRSLNGPFNGVGGYALWWSSAEFNAYSAWNRNLLYNSGNVGRYYNNKGEALSVRCIKD